ncbi:MAG: class A beta-lactamase-related serine hydrolase [Gemmatimonadetes bacterium]|nr:class A beta-lactamase-related serine hydrolase [Gemmatimonadota bacterium]
MIRPDVTCRGGLLVILVGLVLFFAGRISARPSAGAPADAQEQGRYRGAVFTSPFLDGPGAENSDAALFKVRSRIDEYIHDEQAKDPSLAVSVYVRDLNRGSWIGIHDRERYLPSSLTKVAILVHTLAREEDAPGVLDAQVVFPGREAMPGDDSMGDAPDSLRLQAGQLYSRRDLLRRMIAYSDNHASQLLMQGVADASIADLLYELGAEQLTEGGQYFFDARTTASLLCALYHGSLLSRKHSEFALNLLTKSFYQQGLRRLLPEAVVVASKFGFHASLAPDGTPHHELHECGIVYRSPDPYVICVMTRTYRGSPDGLDRMVGDISQFVWAP